MNKLEYLILEKQMIKIEGVEPNPNYTFTYNKFTESIHKELSGRYYKIMYGKKIYNEMLEEGKNQD